MQVRRNWVRPGEILTYFQRGLEAYLLIPQTVGVSVDSPPSLAFLTPEELRQKVKEMVEELEQECVLFLTASVEAAFQVDLWARAEKKMKDPLSRTLRRLLKAAASADRRIEVEEILDVWKRETGKAEAFGNLRQVILYRHWLAHGRYWEQKSGLRNVNPYDAWERWESVRRELPANFPLDSHA